MVVKIYNQNVDYEKVKKAKDKLVTVTREFIEELKEDKIQTT